MHPTLLRIGSFRLATYGVLVAAGYLLGIGWLSRRRERMGLSEDDFWSLVYALFFGALVGGKLLYLAVSWRELLDGSLRPLRDIRYGFVFYGGVAGSMLAGWAWCRYKRLSFSRFADYFAVALPLGQAIGRWGCLAAGCCYGKPTTLPWGVRFTDPESLVSPALAGVPLHPTQLYESAADLLVAWLCVRALARVEAGRWRAGSGWAAYLLLYSVARFTIEVFRGDDRGQGVLGFSPSQAVAVVAFAASSIWLARRRLA